MADQPTPVEHELTAEERGGIHRVQLTAGVEHRFTIREVPWVDVIPVEVMSVDGGAAVYLTFGRETSCPPATVGGRQTRMMPPAVSSLTLTFTEWTPLVIRMVADGPVLISVQRADS